MNAVITQSKPVGESILQGEGAGPGPTSSSLLSDLLNILRGNLNKPFGISSSKRKKLNHLIVITTQTHYIYDLKFWINQEYYHILQID